MNKINEQQIQELYKFTRQHYVEHFDVQTELVDHLANDIEQIWQTQPTLSFEQAKNTSFKKFGVFGFMEVVEARTKALDKKYWKLVWNLFKQFFAIPQILISTTIFILLFNVFKFFTIKWVVITIGLGGFLILIFKLYFLQKEKKKRFLKTNKKWLLEEIIFNLGGSAVFVNFFFQIAIYSPKITSNTLFLLASFLLTSFILLTYIITFVLPSKVEEILSDQYPEYKLAS